MNHIPALTGVALRTRSPEMLADFYVRHLGMTLIQTKKELRVGYGGTSAYVAFRESESDEKYQHDRNDEYWKIGITIPDVDAAYSQLKQRGLTITEPEQFQDIGYLCHITDPEGFQIELLQHSFEGVAKTSPGDPELPLGGGAIIGQITLRASDIDAAVEHYQYDLGMRLLSRQLVEAYGFELYFFAFTQETPPDKNLTAVSNRPWLWQRPYTTLEIQHRFKGSDEIRKTLKTAAGYDGLVFRGLEGQSEIS